MIRHIDVTRPLVVCAIATVLIQATYAQTPAQPQPATQPAEKSPAATLPAMPKKSQAELDADFAKMLSGATLEGSFNTTGAGRDMTRLSADKYSLGEVKKQFGNIWIIQAKLRDTMIPLPLPILWAGDTPVIVVDNFTIPGMGTFSARVMFFEDHYSGYWKHGDRGGNMFGVVHRVEPTEGARGDGQPSTADAEKK